MLPYFDSVLSTRVFLALSFAAGYEVRFNTSTKVWLGLIEEEDRIKQHYGTILFDHKTRLEERTKRSNEIQKAFRGFKLEVSRLLNDQFLTFRP
jgi:hypothetical protein